MFSPILRLGICVILWSGNFLRVFATNSSTPVFTSTLNKNCSCGFYDSTTGNLFTESLIVYFNETDTFPPDFKVQTYAHKYERNWNAVNRQGASPDNVKLGSAADNGDSQVFPNPSLEIFCDPQDPSHLVVGGAIKSVRQDMHYGSFSSLIRGPRIWNRGSAMNMMVYFNESEEFEMNMMNTNKNTTAWLDTLMNGEFTSRDLGVNYSVLANTSLANYTSSPWDYVELKVDWTEKMINFSIGGVISRNVTRKQIPTMPSVPGALWFKHWSVGSKYAMEGPPFVRSVANVGWTRSFFNSSTTTDEERKAFDERCDISDACPMEDTRLRGSTGYTLEATVPWVQKNPKSAFRLFSIIIVSICCTTGALVLINVAIRRLMFKFGGLSKPVGRTVATVNDQSFNGSSSGSETALAGRQLRNSAGSSSVEFATAQRTAYSSTTHTMVGTPAPAYSGPGSEVHSITGAPSSSHGVGASSNELPIEHVQHQDIAFAPMEVDPEPEDQRPDVIRTVPEVPAPATDAATGAVPGAPAPAGPIAPARQRIDYMAGIVALCSLLVTMSHFGLTFLPALDMGFPAHYSSEIWARKTIGPYLLNSIWLGLFFTTSTRFLVVGYLRTGELRGIADKTVQRTFRLMIPVAGVVILEYFLMDCGAINWLEYLPSVSWSTWPYAVRYQDFGTFLNELLELMYLIPNAAPQITFNFCTGVLWTIPVSLQGSWISLLGIIVVYEIKTTWKRFAFYAFCTIMNWYARAWGSYFWLGIILADLDIKYKYRTWLFARAWAHWGLLILCVILVLMMLTNDMVLVWTGIDLLTMERGIHPDSITGLPLAQTPRTGYPFYYEPRLNGLIFAVALQVGVEISPTTQKLISSKVFMWLFPHIFTIYLFHGLIFWSIGSLVCVQLSAIGLPYWANMLVTATVSWVTLFGSLEMVTPAVELLGKHVTARIWLVAHEQPAPKKPTTWPFSKEMLLGRQGGDSDGGLEEREVGNSDVVGVAK
ncbi:hypothetical protein B7494_g1079 [Chlorociboria aeruginascens]|nr:hypothetical protein B7494_g1079 [Chlorociboria aeruginascens]